MAVLSTGKTISTVITLILFAGWFIFWFRCAHMLSQQNKMAWFVKRATILLFAFLVISLTTNIIASFVIICDYGILSIGEELNAFLTITWFWIAIGGVSVILVRGLLQIIHNLRVQVSNNWHNKPHTQEETEAMISNSMKLIIKYFYILRNPHILLIGTLISWLFEVFILSIILFINSGSLKSVSERYLPFFLTIAFFYSSKFLIVAFIGTKLKKQSILNSFHIWTEIKLIVISLVIATTILLIVFLIEFLLFGKNLHSKTITLIVGSAWCIFMWYLTTFWVQFINNKQHKKSSISLHDIVSSQPGMFYIHLVRTGTIDPKDQRLFASCSLKISYDLMVVCVF